MSTTVTLRATTSADLDDLVALARTVAWPHRASDLEMMLDLGSGTTALDEATGGTVGIGFWWPLGTNLATLGLVIVAPAQQGRGIGRRLMQALLDDAHPRAVKLVATAAGRPLYEKMGFQAVGGVRQHQGAYAHVTERMPSIRPASPRDLGILVALDARAIGAQRGALIARLLEHGTAVLLERDGAPAGFAVCRRFGRGVVVGPIVGPDEDAAISLLRAAARPGFVRVDCPEDAPKLAAYLAGVGLSLVDQATTMLRGNWPETAARVRCFGLASQALG